jgi:hypothetical protein
MLAGRAASLRLREYFGAEDFAGPHYRPDDPGELVGQRRRKKLNPMKRREIAESVISGRKSGAEIARLYEISQPIISRIVAQYRANRP